MVGNNSSRVNKSSQASLYFIKSYSTLFPNDMITVLLVLTNYYIFCDESDTMHQFHRVHINDIT